MTDSFRLGTVGLILAMTAGSPVATAQSGTHEIQQLAGCLEVSYRFAEDGASDPTLAVFSPDGRWIAYQSDNDTFVQLFPPGGRKFQIAAGGRPLWSRDGNSLAAGDRLGPYEILSVSATGTTSGTRRKT